VGVPFAGVLPPSLEWTAHRRDGRWVVDCPLIGVYGTGDTLEEAIANLDHAVEVYSSRHPLDLPPVPRRRPRDFAGGTRDSMTAM